jgi:hypothetical protein
VNTNVFGVSNEENGVKSLQERTLGPKKQLIKNLQNDFFCLNLQWQQKIIRYSICVLHIFAMAITRDYNL